MEGVAEGTRLTRNRRNGVPQELDNQKQIAVLKESIIHPKRRRITNNYRTRML